MKQIIALICLGLAACGTAQTMPTSTPTPSQTTMPSLTPTVYVTPTIPWWVTPSPVGPYPAWHMFFNYSAEENGVFEHQGKGDTRVSGLCESGVCSSNDEAFKIIDCDLPACDFQADLMIPLTDYSGEGYSVHLDMHGLGPGGSWIAQTGYTVNAQGIATFCQAHSKSDPDTPRYWQNGPVNVNFDEWHTFKIEVEETETGWGYVFRYFMDDQQLCEYSPPNLWDGNNRYQIETRVVALYPLPQGSSDAPEPIILFIDNFYGDYTP